MKDIVQKFAATLRKTQVLPPDLLLAYQHDITGIRRHPALRPEFIALDLAGERIDACDTRPVVDLIETVASRRPAYLQVQPAALELMVAHDRTGLLRELGLAAVFTYGEHISSESKRSVEAHLGCKVLELYGSTVRITSRLV